MRNMLAVLFLVIFLQAGQVYAGENKIIDQLPVTEKMVALSVEEVESREELVQITDFCIKEDIHITFFVPASFIQRNQDAVTRAAALGHEFGNHGVQREYWLNFNKETIAARLTDANTLTKSVTGKDSLTIKPPYAEYNDQVIQGSLLYHPSALLVRGTDISWWDSSLPQPQAGQSLAKVESGSIITINMRSKSALIILSEAIANLKTKGYTIVPVSELQAAMAKAAVPQAKKYEKRAFSVIGSVDIDKPYMALTFDDGGSQRNVGEILDVLNEYGVPSTFFLTGEWAANNSNLVQRMVNEGHEVANHTYYHAKLSMLDPEQIECEILAAEQTITEITGKGTNYVRPPYGAYNDSVRQVIENLGFQGMVMWSIDTRDWSGISADEISEKVLNKANCGAVVLFHLHGAHTAEALKGIIPSLKNAGYVLTTVDNLNHMVE